MKYLMLLAGFFLSFTITTPAQTAFRLENGDLIFQDLDCGPMCDAIEAVTTGFDGHSFSHVGLVSRRGDTVRIIEAMGAGVRAIPLDSFRQRSSKPMYVGRVKKQYRKLCAGAVAFSLRQLGKAYDDAFIYDNGKYYCSELIYDAFRYANGGKPFFRLEPMTFREPGSDRYFPVWTAYYEKLGQPIPEGKPGCNPGGLSRSGKIEIVSQL